MSKTSQSITSRPFSFLSPGGDQAGKVDVRGLFPSSWQNASKARSARQVPAPPCGMNCPQHEDAQEPADEFSDAREHFRRVRPLGEPANVHEHNEYVFHRGWRHGDTSP
jgi:hypothetical protein